MVDYVGWASGGIRWRVARDELASFQASPFRDFEEAVRVGRVVKDVRIKRVVEVAAAGTTYLAKIYKPAGFWRFLFRSRVRRELSSSLGLLRRGVPTVFLTAVGEGPPGEIVVCEKLEGWGSLESALLDPSRAAGSRRTLAFQYGQFARDVHDAGVRQYDFNPSNVLVNTSSESPEFKVIDFEKMTLVSSLSERERLRGLAKMNRIARLSRTDRLRFLLGYVYNHPEERFRLEEIVGTILDFFARQRRRDAARIGRNCLRENRNFGRFEVDGFRGHYRKKRAEDGPSGLTLEEVVALSNRAPTPYRLVPHESAVEAWKEANRRLSEREALPLAVIVEKGQDRGMLVFPQ